MTTWAEFNKTGTITKKKTAWDDFNSRMSKGAFEAEAYSQKSVEPVLFKNLREAGNTTTTINKNLEPEKTPGVLKTIGSSLLGATGDLFNQMFKNIRGTTQTLATPIAGTLALVPGGATPREAMKESLNMAKTVMMDKSVPFDIGVQTAAQQFLQKYSDPDPRGGYKPTIGNISALTALGVFNLLGDPLFEFGAGLRGAKALKEFATFKKVRQATKDLSEGTSFVKGTMREVEIKVSPDVKIKIQPKTNSITIKGYQRRVPSQKGLPEGKLAPETNEIIMNAREATGMDMTAQFKGDDLILQPTTPIKSVQPVAKGLVEGERTYKIIKQTGIEEVKGTPVKIVDGVDTFLHKDENGNWVVSEATTGRDLTNGGFDNSTFAIRAAKVNIENVGVDKFKKLIEEKQLTQPELQEKIDTAKNIYEKQKIKEPATKARIDYLEQQLKDTQPPEIKKSTLGLKVKQKAVEEDLITRFKNLPEYEVANMQEQAKLATDLINSDFEKAKRVAFGEEMPEGKLLPEAVFTAMEKLALRTKDITLVRQLAKSHTVEQATFMGQRIRALGERDPNNPVKIIQDIEKARAKKVGGKVKEKLTAEQKKIQHEIKMVKKSEVDLEDFIDEIKC